MPEWWSLPERQILPAFTVVVDHGYGIKTRYSRFGVRLVTVTEGDFVAKGDVIGRPEIIQ
jgi:murein DD-endopeptidase MepM/ murein hydrolase activator NlpD